MKEMVIDLRGVNVGSYKYDDLNVQKAVGHEQTFFMMNVTDYTGSLFRGTIKDDLKTGGTPGTGIVHGTMDGIHISFTKEMPIAALRFPGGERKYYKRKHPKLFYKGSLVDGKFKGTWKFKTRLVFRKFRFRIIKGATGTWEMARQANHTEK